MIFVQIALIVAGMALVLWGADRFTDASTAIARRYRISELIIGLTVVAIGTSLPEFMVSLFSALRGSADMSVGNIMGSNIFNALMITGASSLILPMAISRRALFTDMPVTLGISIILVILGCQEGLSRWDGVGLMLIFSAYLGWTTYYARHHREQDLYPEDKIMSLARIVLFLVIGVLCLVVGARLMVDNAVKLAGALGVSERVIAITVLATGTSLPEFATSLVAAYKGREGLAIGNVLGSNIFNILFALGPCAVIRPLSMEGLKTTDFCYFVGSVALLFVLSLTGRRLGRVKGAVLITAYLIYVALLMTH
jgi:cation:H+ antiporter